MKAKFVVYFILSVILISVLTFLTINFINKKLPLIRITRNSEVVNPWGWEIVTFNKYKGLSSYYLIKHDYDTIVNFAFELYKNYGLRGYDLVKEYPSNDSIISIALTLSGDTLYMNERSKTKDLFSVKDGRFIKGKYYFYYTLNRHALDTCQIEYFERYRDSLTKSGTNNIPMFNGNCEIIK